MTTGISQAPNWPDPSVLAELANALFQAPPNQGTVPLAPTTPAVPPSPTLAPAPSVVTSVAPHAPARPPVGPPDLPPVTSFDRADTEHRFTPATPRQPRPGSLLVPLRGARLPQPGGSAGWIRRAVSALAARFQHPAAGSGRVPVLWPTRCGGERPAQRALRGGHPGRRNSRLIAQPSADGYYFLRDGHSGALAPSTPTARCRRQRPTFLLRALPRHPSRSRRRFLPFPLVARAHVPDFSAVSLQLRPDSVPDLGRSGPARVPSMPIRSSETSRSCGSKSTASR